MPDPVTMFDIGTGADKITFRARTTPGSFWYSNDENGPRRGITYLVPGGKGSQAADALFGVGLYTLTTTGGYKYPNPHRFVGNTALTVRAVKGQPLDAMAPGYQMGQGAVWDEIAAEYWVNHLDTDGSEFDTTQRSGTPVPWSSLSVRAEQGEIAVRKNSILADGNPIPPNARTLMIPDSTREYIYQRGMLPNLVEFENILEPLEDHVNDDVFFGFPAGTLLMGPWDTRLQMDATGQKNQEFTMSLRYRKYGWNSMPDPDNPRVWVDVTSNADSHDVIPSASFLPLIQYRVVA